MKCVKYFYCENMPDLEDEINDYLSERESMYKSLPTDHIGYPTPELLDVKFVWDGTHYCALITMNN